MLKSKAKIILCLVLFTCSLSISIWFLTNQFNIIKDTFLNYNEYAWIFRLLLNCMGYAIIFIPGYIIHKYVRKTDILERSGKSWFGQSLHLCFGDVNQRLPETSVKMKVDADNHKTPIQEFLGLMVCFCGLMGSYLTWGLLQEKIMTQDYETMDGTKSRFHDSQFLVFTNRISAFLLASCYLLLRKQPAHKAPLYKYSFCSLSNIMSAWCQYEALKYISFPTQVLSKACKIIPVMLMGKLVSHSKYEYYEYVTAVMISSGMVLFMMGSNDDYVSSTVTTLSGVILLSAYIVLDSFTSNWQGALFAGYGMTPIQMMAGVNLFSCMFTGVSLVQQTGFTSSLDFMFRHPGFLLDCIMLSGSSALGQLFIFHTISTFGPVVFTIIMTLRQAIAILLSCLVYGHRISMAGGLGVAVVFAAVFLRVYCKQRVQRLKHRARIQT